MFFIVIVSTILFVAFASRNYKVFAKENPVIVAAAPATTIPNVPGIQTTPLVPQDLRYTTKVTKLPFSIKTIEDNTLAIGKKSLLQVGQNGEITTVTENTYVADKIVSSKVFSQEITKQALDQITLIGTKVMPKTVVVDGKTITYCKSMRVFATVYDAYWNGNFDNKTALGTKLTKGTIAVKPDVIPYHTKMYIPGYGYGEALDTGGGKSKSFLKSNGYDAWIDLGFENLHGSGWDNWSGAKTIYILCN
jgi:3D (Asp-Asp-Asp) domain-containing protein